MFYCEWIERLDVGIESEEVLLRLRQLADSWRWTRLGLLDKRGRGGQAAAPVITVTPDQAGARGLWAAVITGAPRLVKLLAFGKHFSKWILANDGFPVDRVQKCFTPA
jgi:hypothetical protein